MKLIRLSPPGELCQIQAVLDAIARPLPRRFLDAGCGAGAMSFELCRRGLDGIGVDPSSTAIAVAREALAPFITRRRYRLVQGELATLAEGRLDVDLALSLMVVEHLPDDVAFVRALAAACRQGGQVIVGAPGRRDHWGAEDDVVGHLRRYERDELLALLEAAGLRRVTVRSASVPVANVLFRAGNVLVRRATGKRVATQDARLQTLSSGAREIPFKTVFPPSFRWVLNRRAMTPLFLLQRLFYGTRLGLTLLASGAVP